MRYLIPASLFLVLVVFLFIGLFLNPSEVPSPLIGKPMPVFSLPRLANPGMTITNSDMQGRPALVNVWATWCVACREEHPLLVSFSQSTDVPIYGLNYKDNRTSALRWLKDLGNPYVANLYDEDGRVAIDWGVYGAPETFVVDQQGIIRYKHIGPLTEQVLEKKIIPLLNKIGVSMG